MAPAGVPANYEGFSSPKIIHLADKRTGGAYHRLALRRQTLRQIAEQRQAGESAQAAYGIARRRYEAGLGTYLQVLSAESQVLAQRRLAVDLAARRLDNQVGVMRALGGGYAATPPPTAQAPQAAPTVAAAR